MLNSLPLVPVSTIVRSWASISSSASRSSDAIVIVPLGATEMITSGAPLLALPSAVSVAAGSVGVVSGGKAESGVVSAACLASVALASVAGTAGAGSVWGAAGGAGAGST